VESEPWLWVSMCVASVSVEKLVRAGCLEARDLNDVLNKDVAARFKTMNQYAESISKVEWV
jgi:hypothetical protein